MQARRQPESRTPPVQAGPFSQPSPDLSRRPVPSGACPAAPLRSIPDQLLQGVAAKRKDAGA